MPRNQVHKGDQDTDSRVETAQPVQTENYGRLSTDRAVNKNDKYVLLNKQKGNKFKKLLKNLNSLNII